MIYCNRSYVDLCNKVCDNYDQCIFSMIMVCVSMLSLTVYGIWRWHRHWPPTNHNHMKISAAWNTHLRILSQSSILMNYKGQESEWDRVIKRTISKVMLLSVYYCCLRGTYSLCTYLYVIKLDCKES